MIHIDKDWLNEQYTIKKRTLEDIGKECGCSLVTISNKLNAYGIPKISRIGLKVPLEEQYKRRKIWRKTWREENADNLREYRVKNEDKIRESAKRWRKTNPMYAKDYGSKLKLDALNAYGGSLCIVCGETDIAKLSLDHSKGYGREQRIKIFGNHKIAGYPFYHHLRKNNYPQDLGLQVMCISCNVKVGNRMKDD